MNAIACVLFLAAVATATPVVSHFEWGVDQEAQEERVISVRVGDAVAFSVAGSARVVEVPEYVFSACEAAARAGGRAVVPEVEANFVELLENRITFAFPGTFYFISPGEHGAHCADGGLRLAVVVEADAAEAEAAAAHGLVRVRARRAPDQGSGDGTDSGSGDEGGSGAGGGLAETEFFVAADLASISDPLAFEANIKQVLEGRASGGMMGGATIASVLAEDVTTGVCRVIVKAADSDVISAVEGVVSAGLRFRYNDVVYSGFETRAAAKAAYEQSKTTTTRRRTTSKATPKATRTTTTTIVRTTAGGGGSQRAAEAGGTERGSGTTTIVVVVCVVAVACIIGVGIFVNRKTAKDRVHNDFSQQSSLSRMNFQNPVYDSNVQAAAAAPAVADPFYYSLQRKQPTTIFLDNQAEADAEFEA